MGTSSREHFVQHGAQRVDVGDGRDRLASHLLGAHVIRRHQQRPGRCRRRCRRIGREQFRDTEIEQFRDAVGGDEDISWLEISMDDQVLMRVLHCIADLSEQLQPLFDRQLPLPAPVRDRHAFDVLEHDVRGAVFCCAPIEEPCDVRVFEVRQNLAFVTESRDRGAPIQIEFERLDGDLFVKLIVIADGKVDRAHSTAAERMHDAIRAHAAARPVIVAVGGTGGCARDDAREPAALGPERGQQFPPKLLVGSAALVDEPRAIGRIQCGSGVVERLESLESLRVHTAGGLNAERSQAAPRRTSFSTVLTLMPSTVAISAISRPPKNFNSIARALRASTTASFSRASSRASRSTERGSDAACASSSDMTVAPPPRLAARRRRA
jgi:hypothetical protein